MNAETIAYALNGQKENNQWRCWCPVHGGHALMVRDKGNRPVLHCFGGCEFRDVVRELEARGLWESKPRPKGPPQHKIDWAKTVVAIYEDNRQNGVYVGGGEYRPWQPSAQDEKDYRKAKAVLNEAREVGHAA